MKVIIDIPEELISDIDDENYENVINWFDTTLYCAIRDGIQLPKNATNGDIIKALFPEIALYEKKHNGIEITFNGSFWNAPYKRSEDKNADSN